MTDCQYCEGRGCVWCVQPGFELPEVDEDVCQTCQGRGCRECTIS